MPNIIPIACFMTFPFELGAPEAEPGLSESLGFGCDALIKGGKEGCSEGPGELAEGIAGTACALSCSVPPSVDGGSTGGPPPKLTATAPELLETVPPGLCAGWWSGLETLVKMELKGCSSCFFFSDNTDAPCARSFLKVEPTAAAVAVATMLLAALDVLLLLLPDVFEEPPPNNELAVETIGPNGVPGFGAFVLYEPDANLSMAAMTLPRAPLGLMSSSLPNGMQPPFLHTPRRRSRSVEQRTPSLSVLSTIEGNSRKLILMHR